MCCPHLPDLPSGPQLLCLPINRLLRPEVWGLDPALSQTSSSFTTLCWAVPATEVLTVGAVPRAGLGSEDWGCSEVPGCTDCVVGCKGIGLVRVGGSRQDTNTETQALPMMVTAVPASSAKSVKNMTW